jgi:hypothetical protein
MEDLAQTLKIGDTVRFLDPVPEDKLGAIIHDHDVVFGVFGSSVKARTVIANKVWQGLACGRVVITMSSPALDELVPLVPPDLLKQIVDVEPDSVARAITEVAARSAPKVAHDVAKRLEQYVEHAYGALEEGLRGCLR